MQLHTSQWTGCDGVAGAANDFGGDSVANDDDDVVAVGVEAFDCEPGCEGFGDLRLRKRPTKQLPVPFGDVDDTLKHCLRRCWKTMKTY